MNRNTAMAATAVLLLVLTPQVAGVVRAAPGGQAPPAPNSAAATFTPSCLSGELADLRPDPAWVGASYEHDACVAPKLPGRINGATAKRETVLAAMAAAKAYGVAAGNFQQCIADYLARRKMMAARSGRPIPPWLPILENHRILASQKNIEQGDAQLRSTVDAFNAYGSECEDHG